ncbi:MAG TPA: hypothetical protein PLL06_00340 [Acidobacteriota bacterium]|nr:hypothetical protein [Acidobacteriota bacterium]HNB73220.1 hypothetical protein [Acidobacteriota bacterium]HNC45420.1 hypothetical protein [Acidobacteriota bacterium]HNG93351.1 hypothetical protein [Acidobacteriota bacterium]
MTHDEMERSINFLLDSQATLTAKVGQLTENQAKLTADVAEMKVQAELDRALVREMFREMAQRAEADRRMAREMFQDLTQNAEADRRMVREMIRDLKDVIYRVDDKADEALKLARKNNPPDEESM